MRIKKIITGLLMFSVSGSVVFAAYLYTRNFNVPYTGWARLDYNWRYFSASCPKDSYRFNGKFFSFDYPRFSKQNPVRESLGAYGGMVYSDDKLMEIMWEPGAPATIKAEVAARMAYNGPDMPALSNRFVRWLVAGEDGSLVNPAGNYDVSLKKVDLDEGGAAILITATSKAREWPHMRYLVGIAPGGTVFKLSNKMRFNIPDKYYWKELARPSLMGPRPEQDAASACAFKRVVKTFEVAK